MVISFPSEIRTDREGFEWLGQMYRIGIDSGAIEIDITGFRDFDANLRAAFGVVFAFFREKGIKVSLCGAGNSDTVRQKFLRNTCLPYKRFFTSEVDGFGLYAQKILAMTGMPKMSEGVRRTLGESLLEVFVNSQEHSGTRLGIYACGHNFPDRRMLQISVADAGIGFRQRILNVLGLEMPDSSAITWAVNKRNTVKKGLGCSAPGGVGLKDLKRFVSLNNGSLNIVSQQGYWTLSKDEGCVFPLQKESFPGTVVNLFIRTDDAGYYHYRSEVNEEGSALT